MAGVAGSGNPAVESANIADWTKLVGQRCILISQTKESDMKNIQLISLAVCFLFLVARPGCSKDGDGQLELKEPKKELSEMPERKNWLEIDITEDSPDK